MEENAIKIANAIWDNAGANYQNVVPRVTLESPITDLSNIFLNSNYTALANEFVSTLINKIGLTVVREKLFKNGLAVLKKGNAPLGQDIEEIYENPTKSQQFDNDTAYQMAKLLQVNKPDTKVAYYRMNRQETYTKTISKEMLKRAFTSWDKLGSYIQAIINSLYNGANIDEYTYIKNLVNNGVAENKICIEAVSNTIEDTPTAIVKKFRELFIKFLSASAKYNSYAKFEGSLGTPVTTFSNKSDICVIIPSEILALVDVDVLAKAFNIGKADFMGEIIPVDDLDDGIIGVIFDKNLFSIYDVTVEGGNFFNVASLTNNIYLHVFETLSLSPLNNGVALVKESALPNIASTGKPILTTDTAVNGDVVYFRNVPCNSTDDVVIAVEDGGSSVFEMTKDGTGIIITDAVAGETITFTNDNGATTLTLA